MDNISEKARREIEKNYVFATYDSIASEFSSTRYKKWPKVEEFLDSIAEGSLVLDVGCGNGKYLDNPRTISLGCDISRGLLRICKNRGYEVVQCDMVNLPYREASFDAIICIASLHHISDSQRRLECLRDMVELLSSRESKLLIQVWSFEQDKEKDNPYIKSFKDKNNDSGQTSQEISVADTDVKLPIHKNRTPFKNQDILVPFTVKSHHSSDSPSDNNQRLRFYHVFREGELEEMIGKISGATIVDSYYDKGNWCAIVSRV